MRMAVRIVGFFLLLIAANGCGSDASAPPPQIQTSEYSGTGDLMARCMQYASESHCEREIWGGDEM
jgi:hypothetical protein